MTPTYQDIKTKLEETVSFGHFLSLTEKHDKAAFFIAGGVIRNFMVDPEIAVKDIDIFYSGDIEDFLSELESIGILSLGPFGSWRWFPASETSVYYDIISIEDFYQTGKCYTMQDVLRQFDITASCLAFSIPQGQFFSEQNTLRDIEDKLIRLVRFDFPDVPVSKTVSLSRLVVLWFRLAHYSSLLGYTIEPKTFNWLKSNKKYYNKLNTFTDLFFAPQIDESMLSQLDIEHD